MEEKINWNGKEYVLVNDDIVDGKRIYHFLSEEMIYFLLNYENYEINEKRFPIFSIFAEKIENQYILIQNEEKFYKYLQYFGMMPEYVIPIMIPPMIGIPTAIAAGYILQRKIIAKTEILDGDKRKDLIDEQKEAFKGIKEKLKLNIDTEKIDEKIDNLKVYSINGRIRNLQGFYYPIDNSVNINKDCLEGKDEFSKQTRTHETIHYLAGRKYGVLFFPMAKLLGEGGTQNIVDDYFDNGFSEIKQYRCLEASSEKERKANVQYNFTDYTAYSPIVSLVKQLEYVTHKKSYESSINGDTDFLKSVVKELGILPTLKIIGQSGLMLMKLKSSESIMGSIKMQKNIQNYLLKIGFDKKFKSVDSIDDAQKFLEELREFETCRAKITVLYKDGTIKKDNEFEKYYEERYQKLCERFPEYTEKLEDYKYKEQEYRELKGLQEKPNDDNIKKFILSKLMYKFKGKIEDIPREQMVSIYETKRNCCIGSINDNIEINSFINLFDNEEEELIISSIKIKNPNFSDEECIKQFIEQANMGKSIKKIEFSEEEINEEYKRWKKIDDIRKSKENKAKEMPKELKKITIFDKIKNRINNWLHRDRKNNNKDKIENEEEKPKEKSTLKSWDLANWGEETKENVERKQKEVISKIINEDKKPDEVLQENDENTLE